MVRDFTTPSFLQFMHDLFLFCSHLRHCSVFFFDCGENMISRNKTVCLSVFFQIQFDVKKSFCIDV